MKPLSDFQIRQQVCQELRQSPITGPLLDTTEKMMRPKLTPARQLAVDEALVFAAGLADLYEAEIRRKVEKVRQGR